MRKIIIFLIGTLLLHSCTYDIVDIDEVNSGFEEAYFEGQRDALTGDVRIKKNSDSCWVWTKSCWDNGKTPTFNPSIVCGDN